VVGSGPAFDTRQEKEINRTGSLCIVGRKEQRKRRGLETIEVVTFHNAKQYGEKVKRKLCFSQTLSHADVRQGGLGNYLLKSRKKRQGKGFCRKPLVIEKGWGKKA